LKHVCRDDFFSTDTPESFYWAGFLAADGCLKDYKNSKMVALELANKDRDHLAKFKDCIGFVGDIMTRGTRPSSIVKVSSARMFDDLHRFGLTPRKSLTLLFPEAVASSRLVNHFMRGYFDGDGCFSTPINKVTGVKRLRSEVLGTHAFLSTFVKMLSDKCSLPPKRLYVKGNVFSFSHGGTRKAIQLRDFLYENATDSIMLTRKYTIAHLPDFICRPKSFVSNAVIATNIITGAELSFESSVAADMAGFNRHRVSDCCRGIRAGYKGHVWRYV
jgi:hypothetical protein